VQQRRSETVEHQEAHDIGERDVHDANARGDHEPERPDHQIGGDVIAPLVAEHRNPIRRREQQAADGEVCRIPEMVAAVLQHVLRRDGEEAAEHERPERSALRLEQEREADAADVGALQIHHASAHECREQRFGDRAGEQCDSEALVSADDVVPQLRGEEDECDQARDQIPRVERSRALPPSERWLGNGAGVGHCVMTWAR